VVRALASLVLLTACGGPVEQTLVDELRVLAAVPDTPEVAPGETLGVRLTVLDPADAGFESLAWLCTPTGPPGSPCLEATRSRTEGWTTSIDQDGRGEGLLVPAALAGALSDDDVPQVQTTLWVLSCTPGTCPLVQQGAPGAFAVEPGWDDLVEHLSDPAALARELPLQGVALTRRSVVVSLRPPDARNQHPVLTDLPVEPPVAPVDGEATFSVTVDDAQPTALFAYTTVGGFAAVETTVDEGQAELTWFPGESSEDGQDAELILVASDGLGGESVWRGLGEVRGEAPVE